MLILLLAPFLRAQEPTPGEAPIATLHAYADLIQIPVLVLDHDRRSTPKFDPRRFTITLDAGRPFRPTYIRTEGDDPINLAILLDVRDFSRDAFPEIDKAIARLAPLSLHPRDQVTIYTLDCSLIHTHSLSPEDPALLGHTVDAALQSWRSRDHQQKGSGCPHPIGLWDTISYLSEQLGSTSGRRVIIAISSGIDHGSRLTWNEARTHATASAVSVFGIRYQPTDSFGRFLDPASAVGEPGFFRSLSELSGGIVLNSKNDDMPDTLKHVIQMIRERYIVEFPRPRTVTAGAHQILVFIAKSNALIRPGGISVPLPDPETFTNPAAPPPDPEKTPDVGTRRILLPNPTADEP
ncbi:hypothetical protein [Granulicella sibirica]|uniref:VWFA domain-containing protein n=1 Tax=Granulicella sibirica TaxID=2479048 RepID=A0A4Q0T0P2_9BACT|nr:hypothetical protein [Granulicella sibirica]RXH57145.1 hypothetical protein GRAN_0455 [Granulicella sibirica]